MSHCDGQIQVFARILNPLERMTSVTVFSNATVHDLTVAICDKSGISEDAIPSITVQHAGTELSPLDALADVGAGPEMEVTLYFRHHECKAGLHYIAKSVYDDDSIRVPLNISISEGHDDILEEIKHQVLQWAASRDPPPWDPPNPPIAFVLRRTTWHETVASPLEERRGLKMSHFLDYQRSKSHIGRFKERSAILSDETLLRHLRNASIPRIASEFTVESGRTCDIERKYALIHEKASVLLSQLCSPMMSSVRIWTQRPRYQHVIFVHLAVPEGFEILLRTKKPSKKLKLRWFT